jgi:hypothetical protein
MLTVWMHWDNNPITLEAIHEDRETHDVSTDIQGVEKS